MKNRTHLKIRLLLKLCTLTLLGVLVTPPTYTLLGLAALVAYQYFVSVLIACGGGLVIKWLIKSLLADYDKLRRKKSSRRKRSKSR